MDLEPRISQTQLTACRREFHRFAESGFLEFRTTARIAEGLAALGLSPMLGTEALAPDSRMGVPDKAARDDAERRAREEGAPREWLDRMAGVTGLAVDLLPGLPPHTVLRFDIDAVDVQESLDPSHRPAREGFASAHGGVSHACGHDGHIAIGLGLAHELARLRGDLRHNVRLLFQPAEEGCRGAKAMAEAGMVDGAKHLLAPHIGVRADRDGSLVCGAKGFLATTKFDVSFTGRAAHAGAKPHLGANSLLAAAAAALGMHGIPRHGDGDSRITVGTLEAGSGRNVIPSHAAMRCETRGATSAVDEFMFRQARSIVEHCAAMYGQEHELRLVGGSVSADSDDSLIRIVREAAAGLDWFRPDLVSDSAPGYGSDDACVLMARVQASGGDAAYLMLGSDLPAGHHSPDFDFSEELLLPSVSLLLRCVAMLDRI